MANRVNQLAGWMKTRADNQSASIKNIQAATLEQLNAVLPAAYQGKVSEVLFAKAKRLCVRDMYRDRLTALKDNTTLRQEILAVFPEAEFSVRNDGVHFSITIKV